jgi:hypothetical protein
MCVHMVNHGELISTVFLSLSCINIIHQDKHKTSMECFTLCQQYIFKNLSELELFSSAVKMQTISRTILLFSLSLCRRLEARAITIEVLGATLEETCLKKGDIFQLISTPFCEVKRGPLKNFL